MPEKMTRTDLRPILERETERQRRLRELEDMPMCRCTAAAPPSPVCPGCTGRPGGSTRATEELLERQNALLCELLCAVNGISAALCRKAE